jgi:hypothetical protein
VPVLAAVALLVLAASTGCGPKVDLTTGLQVLDIATGWSDAGIVNGQNKLVPAVTFRLKNVSDQPLTTLQANVLFQRINVEEEWGSGFLRVTGSEGLAPGASTDTLSVKSQLGYTGTEPRAEMLRNSQFVDAKVRILAKYGSSQWTPLGEYPVDRRLVTQ